MATLAQLDIQGAIHRVDIGDGSPVRLFYAFPRFREWLEGALQEMTSDRGLEISPLEQVVMLLEDFVSGEPLSVGRQFNTLDFLRGDRGLWKLKTPDVRIFGWFPKKDVFVAVSGHSATFVKRVGLYPGLANEVETFRDQLDLDPPKTILGDNPDGVVSHYSIP